MQFRIVLKTIHYNKINLIYKIEVKVMGEEAIDPLMELRSFGNQGLVLLEITPFSIKTFSGDTWNSESGLLV